MLNSWFFYSLWWFILRHSPRIRVLGFFIFVEKGFHNASTASVFFLTITASGFSKCGSCTFWRSSLGRVRRDWWTLRVWESGKRLNTCLGVELWSLHEVSEWWKSPNDFIMSWSIHLIFTENASPSCVLSYMILVYGFPPKASAKADFALNRFHFQSKIYDLFKALACRQSKYLLVLMVDSIALQMYAAFMI